MQESRFLRSERERMVREQIEGRGIKDKRLLAAMREIPRHFFVPPEYSQMAYADGPLPIGEGQTISQPYIVALMTSLLNLEGQETVLEIGTGSGYQAAMLAYLAGHVYSIERHADLAQQAREKLQALGLTNVEIVTGDGSRGLSEHAPYQGIMVTAAAPEVPKPYLEQLADGGILVIPVGGFRGQMLEQWIRRREQFDRNTIAPVAFVPLRGDLGFRNGEWPAPY